MQEDGKKKGGRKLSEVGEEEGRKRRSRILYKERMERRREGEDIGGWRESLKEERRKENKQGEGGESEG